MVSPLTLPLVLRGSGGDGDAAMVCDRMGCGDVDISCGGDLGIGIASSSGDGIVCMFFELVPRRRPLRTGLDRFSGEEGRSPAFLLSFRLLMTVPSRLSPNPRGLRSGVAGAGCDQKRHMDINVLVHTRGSTG